MLQADIRAIKPKERPSDTLKISLFFQAVRALDPRFDPLILQLEINKTIIDYSAIIAYLTEAERRIRLIELLKESAFSAKAIRYKFKRKRYNCSKTGHKSNKCKGWKKEATEASTGLLITPGGRKGLSPPPESAMEATWVATTGITKPIAIKEQELL